MKKALLMVNIQRDFCPGGTLAVPNGDKVIEPLNRMVDFATQD
ncbi:MAG: nicotinamidase, partial [Candidatus Yanofskybacteria bacterium]|nr:nicotinamidase [Candidatus Yanofskybacteria bacterium]